MGWRKNVQYPKLAQSTAYVCFLCSCLCVGVHRKAEKLHCDLSLSNLVSWADLSFMWSKQLLKTPEISLKKKPQKMTKNQNAEVHDFVYLSVCHNCWILMRYYSSSRSLFLFVHWGGGVSKGGGNSWLMWGVGWQAGDRPSSLSPPGICPLLPTLF